MIRRTPLLLDFHVLAKNPLEFLGDLVPYTFGLDLVRLVKEFVQFLHIDADVTVDFLDALAEPFGVRGLGALFGRLRLELKPRPVARPHRPAE